MADTKISALTDGAPALSSDEIIVARSGVNRKLDLSAALMTLPTLVPLSGAVRVRVTAPNLAIGDNDIYTVPANTRAIIGQVNYYNQSLGTIGVFAQIGIGGTYYRIGTSLTLATLVASNHLCGYIAEAGEILSINTITTNGLNVFTGITEFPNTGALKSAKLTSLSTGNNTLYTCPASTATWVMAGSTANIENGQATINYVNQSGASRIVDRHIVPSEQSVGVNYQVVATTNPGINNARVVSNIGSCALGAGDFINVNVDDGAATQWAWVNVAEMAV